MINEVILKVKQDPMLYYFLKRHSYWYKNLMRDSSTLRRMIDEMREEYKLTTKDKIQSLSEKMNMVSSLLEVLS